MDELLEKVITSITFVVFILANLVAGSFLILLILSVLKAYKKFF